MLSHANTQQHIQTHEHTHKHSHTCTNVEWCMWNIYHSKMYTPKHSSNDESQCCSVLQCVAVCCSVLQSYTHVRMWNGVCGTCIIPWCMWNIHGMMYGMVYVEHTLFHGVCGTYIWNGVCGMWNCVCGTYIIPWCMWNIYSQKCTYLNIPAMTNQSVAVCCSVLQCVAVCCSVLQCVAVC